MKLKSGFLTYLHTEDIWFFEDVLGYALPLEGGEKLYIRVCGRYRACTLDGDQNWYVIFADVCFVLKPAVTYSAKLLTESYGDYF